MVTQLFRDQEMFDAEGDFHDPLAGSGFYNASQPGGTDYLHMSAGCGLKLIMNRNLIVSVDMGRALYNRDGQKMKTFIGFNYIF